MNGSAGTSETFLAPAAVALWRRRALLLAVPFTIAAVIGWVLEYDQFYHSYLIGFMLVLGLALGSMAWVMVYHTTGGAWGTVLRRILEAASNTIWAVAVAFIPIVIGIHRLYPWSRPEDVAKDPHLQQIGPVYLNLKAFIVRAVLYFTIWIVLNWMLMRFSDAQDLPGNRVTDQTLRRWGGVGLVLYTFTITLSPVDWVMSLDPHWTSTIYGLLYMAGQGLIALSFGVIVLALLVRTEPMRGIVHADQFLDHGKLLLAVTMLWGWFTLSQWLIIWAGNLPEEISWYMNRSRGGWRQFAFPLIIGHFFVPFFILLSRNFKSNSEKLMKLAVWIIFMRYWDLYWYIIPNFETNGTGGGKGHFHYSWLDAVVPIALLSWWTALFLYNLGRRPLLVLHDDHVKLLLEEGHAFEQSRAS